MFTADAHCDTLLHLESGAAPETINDQTLRQGGVGLQVFALFNGDVPPLRGGIQRALHQLSLLSRLNIPLCKTRLPDIPPRQPMAVLSIEGSEILEDSLEALQHFRREGVRMLNLTWNHENSAGTPAFAGPGRLKPFGLALLKVMDHEGILPDVSHLNEDGFWDVLEYAALPAIASHSCARALCDHPRNLTDRQIKALIEVNGFMGINFCPEFLCADGKADLQTIADHIDHVVQLGGIGIVGMGSDFDGISAVPVGMENASCYPALWAVLEKRGYSRDDIAAIAGLNLYRVLRSAEEGIQ